MRKPRMSRRNIPSVFNFKVNPRLLYEDDFDLVYTAEKDSVGDLWVVYWEDPVDCRVKNTLYNTKDVLNALNTYDWLLEYEDYEPTDKCLVGDGE